jgi:peptidoglycan hydrolase CwlO-like protein
MKNIILGSIVLVSSVSVFALTPKGETVKKKAVETYVATKEYTIEQKNEFVTGLKTELNELDKDIAVLKNKASTKTDEASKEVKLQVKSLEEKRAELNLKIDKLSSASKAAWTELRSGVQSAFKEMKTSFNKASEKLK